MPDRHFYLLRHHIILYTFLDFCLLAPDEIRILCGKNKGFLQKKCVNPLGFNFQRKSITFWEIPILANCRLRIVRKRNK